MTNFVDGPAFGQTLMLKRAPIFLRVVQDAKGKFDALDQLSDTPRAEEKIFAYVIIRKPGAMHIRASGNRGGFYTQAEYKFVPEQPDDLTMRNGSRWPEWCRSSREKYPLESP